MKTLQALILVATFISLIGLSAQGFAADSAASQTEKTTDDNSSTQDLLINKLEYVYKNLAPNDQSKIPVTLRLADLHAERARLAAMKDLESGCTVCKAGEEDRNKALRLYQEALPKTPESSRGRVMIQVGHLYELMGREKEAIASYEAIAKDGGQSVGSSDTYLSLAEIYFKKNRYAEAKTYYRKVMDDTKAGSRGLAAYRLAWCELNLGDLNAGLSQFKSILTTKDLQSKSGVADGQADHQFVEEVSRDLATWMAKVPVGQTQIEELAKLSPDNARQGNLITLAAELERSGKKDEGTLVWQYVQNSAPQPEVRLEAQIRLVTVMFKPEDTSKSAHAFELALAQWQELKGCGKSDCSEMQKSLRAFLVNWNQTEKKNPSESLQKGYQQYLQTFPKDAEMAQWGAQVARDRKDWSAAASMMHIAAVDLSADNTDGKQDVKLESVLLGELEIAELSKDKALWSTTAQNYLTMSPKKTKAFEVRYQLAHNIYDSGDYKTAREKLRALAMETSAPRELRIQSAHLSLDALNLLKDEAGLSADAKVFATTFGGEEANEFSEIRYKASMNEVAQLATQDPDKAYIALTTMDVAPTSADDKKLYLKDKMILAEKSKRYAVAAVATDEYLALKNLTAEERELALSKKAWLSELRLDFVTAMKSTQNLQTTLKPDQKALKLAMYADLSGSESQAYYEQYLKVGTDDSVKQAIATHLVRTAKNRSAELTKQSKYIAKDPELLARLYTEIYVQAPDPKLLAKILADKRIEKTTWGRSLARIQVLDGLKPITEKIAAMKIDGKTQRTMGNTIKARATELTKLEKMAEKTAESGDWTTQIVSLESLAKESERFYQEILSLPMPEGLSGEEESQYLNLLTQQASPYKSRADSARAKTKELWATANWADSLQKSLNEAGEFKVIVSQEIAALKSVASPGELAKLNSLTDAPVAATAKPSRQIIESAREEVRQSPFDSQRIQNLLGLEKQAGNVAMVRYLAERLQNSGSEKPKDSSSDKAKEKTL